MGTDFRAGQRIRIWDGTNDRGFTNANRLFIGLGDGSQELSIAVVDSAYGATPTSLRVSGKYEATPTTYADGDATPLLTDENGKLITVTSVSIPFSYTDDSAYVPGTDKVGAIGAMADETAPDSVDEGDIGIPRMTLDRKLLIRVVGSTDANRLEIDSSGNITANAAEGKVDDAAFGVATDKVIPMGALADETAPDSVDEGDIGTPRMTLDRKLLIRVVGADDANRLDIGSDGAALTNDKNVKADDGAFTVATDKVFPMGAIADETAPDSVDEGDIGAPRMTLDRKLLIRVVGASDANRLDISSAGAAAINITQVGGVAHSELNPVYVQVVRGTTSGIEFHSHRDQDVNKDATDNHDVTVTTSKTARVVGFVITASGATKGTLSLGPIASLVQKYVAFTSGASPTWYQPIDPPLELAEAGGTETIRLARRNDDNQTQGIYSTIVYVEF